MQFEYIYTCQNRKHMTIPKFYTSFKTALSAGLFSAVVFIGLFFYLGVSQREFSYADSKQIAEDVARRATQETQDFFTTSQMVARSLAQRGILYKNMNADRQQVVDMLYESLKKNPGFLSTWTMWEPNAYDGKDDQYVGSRYYDSKGHLSTTFFWDGDSIMIEESLESDYLEKFYTLPTLTGRDQVIEPYYYQYKGHSQTYYEVSVVVPIKANDKILGVFAVDIDLVQLQKQLSQIKPYGTGFVSLISSDGHIIYHPDSTLVKKDFFSIPNTEECPMSNVFSLGEEYMLETISSFTGQKVFRFFYPIRIVHHERYWAMMVEIPISSATHRTTQLIYVSIVFAILGFVTLLFLFLNILDRKKFDHAVSNALKEVEEKNKLAIKFYQNYEQIFNSTNEAFFVIDAETMTIEDVNNVTLQMYGYDNKQEIITKSAHEFSVNQETANILLDNDSLRQVEDRENQFFEREANTKSGENFWIEISFKKVELDGVTKVLAVVRDISERKNTQLLIEQSEKRFRELEELLPQIVWESDLKGKILYANQVGFQIYGFNESDLKRGIYLKEVMTEESWKKASQHLKMALSTQFPRDEAKNGVIHYSKRKDGTIFPIEVFYNLILQDGKTIGIRGVASDITDRLKAETALHESKQLFETLTLASPVGIFRTDTKGKTTYVNPTWCALSGLKEEDALGEGWTKAVHPDDRKVIAQWDERHANTQNSIAEYRFVRPNNSIVWVLGSALPEFSNGKFKGYIGTITNITEIKKTQQELEDSKDRYQAIMEASPDIILVTDPEFNIVYGNDALERILGVEPRDYLNSNRTAKIHPEDAVIELEEIDKLLKSDNRQSGIIEVRFYDSDGKMHWFSEIISKISLNNKTYLQIIARDITEKKLIEEELLQYRDNLEDMVTTRTKELEEALHNLTETQSLLIQSEKMASLGVLTAGIAHEINNPLNFIQGGVMSLQNFINDKIPQYTSEVEPFLNAVLEGVNRSASIVRSLNRYSRKDEISVAPCNVHTIIDACLVMLNSEIVNKITVNKQYCCKEFILLCNEGKMHQALLNVLANAINSIEEKGTISITTLAHKEEFKIIIADTGCGISTENINRLTDPFYTTKPPGEGTGLGLPITYTIIADHDGTIDFKSKKDVGTTVTIPIPIKN